MWIIIIILLGAVIYYFATLDYIKTIDYSLVTKYGNYDTANKEDMVKEIVSEDGNTIYDYYRDYVVIYIRDLNGSYRFSRIQFCNDEYTFGLWNITVGTSKTKVRRIMRNTRKLGSSTYRMCDDSGQLVEMNADKYVDKTLEDVFVVAYDEDDKVRYISIRRGGLL